MVCETVSPGQLLIITLIRPGTEGDLKMRPAPAASRSTASVKVPLPSTPMRQGATSLAATALAGDPDILHDEQAGSMFANY